MDKLSLELPNKLSFLLQVSLKGTGDMMLSGMSDLIQIYEGNVFLNMLPEVTCNVLHCPDLIHIKVQMGIA